MCFHSFSHWFNAQFNKIVGAPRFFHRILSAISQGLFSTFAGLILKGAEAIGVAGAELYSEPGPRSLRPSVCDGAQKQVRTVLLSYINIDQLETSGV